MIKFTEGNIFESPAQTLVNTVNTVGAMGKGIAKDFKRLFPEMFKEYQQLCETGKIKIGDLWLFRTSNKFVLNFPTKEHWRQPSKIEHIELGLRNFIKKYEEMRISSIAFPKLGCGNGELDWAEVKPLMRNYLKDLPIDIYIYEKQISLSPEHKNIKMMKEWLKSEPRSYPFDEFKNDLQLLFNNEKKFTENKSSLLYLLKNDGIEFKFNNSILFVPWKGTELGRGWLEIWSFIREKGICTSQDLLNMGFTNAKYLINLLLKIEYLQEMKMINDTDSIAVQLKPTKILSTDRTLFDKSYINSEIL